MGTKREIKVVVPPEGEGIRVDRWLCETLADPMYTRSHIQKLMGEQVVHVNGVPCKPNQKLKAQDEVFVCLEAVLPSLLVPVPMDLEILYEDESLLVLNKPAGISVHPGAGTPMPSLAAGVLAHINAQEARQMDPNRPGVVRRLDKDTTGVMVFAKTLLAHQGLSKQFHDKTNERTYVALLEGLLPTSATTCESYLHRDPHHRLKFASTSQEDLDQKYRNGIYPQAYRWAKSLFTPLQYFAHSFTYAQIRLYTGRTHQIRVHAQSLGHPVVGDPLYQRKRMYPTTFPHDVREAVSGTSRQMLHAASLAFTHPVTQDKMSFEAPVPADFQRLLSQLAPFARKVV